MPWVWGPRGHRGGVGSLPDMTSFRIWILFCDLEQETCLEKKKKTGGVPGDPVVRTPLHCRGHGFHPCSGN